MALTQRLYYTQPPITRFTARVLTCAKTPGGWAIVLDSTAFYPEGGGQPADWGVLGGRAVVDVQESGGIITHFTDGPLEVGSEVTGQIDEARRFDYTQQHSGEHILSGILHSMYGADNLGFHISADVLTMDTSVPISPGQLLEAEAAANRIVWANEAIEAVWHDKQSLKALTYRSKKELDGPVRLITVPNADCCACCGTHVQRTGEIGMIKIIQWQKYKTGTRLFVVCGQRALRDYEQKRSQCTAIGVGLSAKSDALAEAVARQSAELDEAKLKISALELRLLLKIAASLPEDQPPIVLLEDVSPDSLRRMVGLLSERTTRLTAAFCKTEAGLAYALACSAKGADLRPVCKQLNAALNGRGGGKPGFVQGSLQTDFATAEAFLLAVEPF